MNALPIRNYLAEHAAAAGLDLENLSGPSGSPENVLRLVLLGAKLPLDKVADVAALIECDARCLFRVALMQFYRDDTIQLLERMLGQSERNPAEEAWLSLVRRAAGGRAQATEPNRPTPRHRAVKGMHIKGIGVIPRQINGLQK
jgi:hypothetical protein